MYAHIEAGGVQGRRRGGDLMSAAVNNSTNVFSCAQSSPLLYKISKNINKYFLLKKYIDLYFLKYFEFLYLLLKLCT
jgi:hypothetical protein